MRAALRNAALHSAAPRARAFSVVSRLKNFVLGRVGVGKDEVAHYFVQQSGAGPPRRVFELHKADADFTDVSPEWLAWLRGTRAEPPTAEESARLAEQRATVQRNAAERARAEALRRDRARVLKADAATDGPADALGAGVQSWTPGAKDK
jgi:NADH:ubiquinone oxidoreductase subunit